MNTLNLIVPSDVVSLPSGGLFYNTNVMLDSVTLNYLVGADEDMLSTPSNWVDIYGLYEKIIKKKIVNQLPDGFSIRDFLKSDIEAMIFFLASTSYGNKITYNIADITYNGERFKYELDLNNDSFFNFKDLTHLKIDEDKCIIYEDNDYEVRYRFLTLGDETNLFKTLDNLRKNNIIDEDVYNQSKKLDSIFFMSNKISSVLIKSENRFIKDKNEIKLFLERVNNKWFRTFKKYYINSEPGINWDIEIVSPNTQKTFFRYAKPIPGLLLSQLDEYII